MKNQLVGTEVVRVKIPKCMSWLDACDEPIGNLDRMEDKVDNQGLQSTPQVLPSFEVYTPPMTYSKEVEETLGTPMEVEPLDKTQLEDLGLNSCNNDIPFSYKEALIFDELELQPQPLPNCPSLDVSLGEERGLEPPIKPHSLDSFRMKGFTAVLAVLVIEASQSRQHGKSESDLTSHLPQSLFDVGSKRISIVTVNT
nr:hypothetical protein [Tanacetum cinerariifolium]